MLRQGVDLVLVRLGAVHDVDCFDVRLARRVVALADVEVEDRGRITLLSL